MFVFPIIKTGSGFSTRRSISHMKVLRAWYWRLVCSTTLLSAGTGWMRETSIMRIQRHTNSWKGHGGVRLSCHLLPQGSDIMQAKMGRSSVTRCGSMSTPLSVQSPGRSPGSEEGTLSFFLIALCLAVAVYIIALCFIAIVLYCFMSLLFDFIDLCLSLPFYCIDFYVSQWHFWYFIASCLLLC